MLSLFDRLDRRIVLIYNKVNKRVTRQSKLSWLRLMKNLNWGL